jgi:hypothetical protein
MPAVIITTPAHTSAKESQGDNAASVLFSFYLLTIFNCFLGYSYLVSTNPTPLPPSSPCSQMTVNWRQQEQEENDNDGGGMTGNRASGMMARDRRRWGGAGGGSSVQQGKLKKRAQETLTSLKL